MFSSRAFCGFDRPLLCFPRGYLVFLGDGLDFVCCLAYQCSMYTAFNVVMWVSFRNHSCMSKGDCWHVFGLAVVFYCGVL